MGSFQGLLVVERKIFFRKRCLCCFSLFIPLFFSFICFLSCRDLSRIEYKYIPPTTNSYDSTYLSKMSLEKCNYSMNSINRNDIKGYMFLIANNHTESLNKTVEYVQTNILEYPTVPTHLNKYFHSKAELEAYIDSKDRKQFCYALIVNDTFDGNLEIVRDLDSFSYKYDDQVFFSTDITVESTKFLVRVFDKFQFGIEYSWDNEIFVHSNREVNPANTQFFGLLANIFEFILLANSFFLSSRLMENKELRMRSVLRMSGMRLITYFKVHFSFSFIYNLVSFLLIYLSGIFFIKPSFLQIILSLICLFACINTYIGLTFFITSFFKTVKNGTVVSNGLSLILTAALCIVGQFYDYLPASKIYYAIGFPPFYGFRFLINLPSLIKPTGSTIDISDSLLALLVSCVYLLLGFYREMTQSTDFAPLRPLFFLDKQFWNVNKVKPNLYAKNGLVFDNVVKTFENDTSQARNIITAVDNLSIKAKSGQVLALLGHNGSGKTTSINLIQGFIQADSGSIHLFDLDPKKQATAIRLCTGVCPQHDGVYNLLTVSEHIDLIAAFREIELSEAEKTDLLKKVVLDKDKDKKGQELSGGMKRRLCLTLALVGNPPILVLDEPSSGLDPEHRRRIWKLLEEQKNNGAFVILTTHHLEEAEALGDSICILAKGKLQAMGSLAELKEAYACAYALHLSVKPNRNVQDISNWLNQFFTARLTKEEDETITFLLAEGVDQLLPDVLDELHDECVNGQRGLNIVSYGLTTQSLEDVFLKLNPVL
eukprot:TRINITY_DN1595_c0_g1_i1.p1 TRINITY_DN1595_c0_g1~~TRINITY_DN1595_c0_g1_i1.p1  ORF type:complete len:768 (+),score=183.20 TRINITY_DN1595_c0_g1_i1:96-2399(+)